MPVCLPNKSSSDENKNIKICLFNLLIIFNCVTSEATEITYAVTVKPVKRDSFF